MESDTTGGRVREIARLAQSAAIAFHSLPDGAVCIIPPERRSLSIIRRRDQGDVTWPAPDWIGAIQSVEPEGGGVESRRVLGAAIVPKANRILCLLIHVTSPL